MFFHAYELLFVKEIQNSEDNPVRVAVSLYLNSNYVDVI